MLTNSYIFFDFAGTLVKMRPAKLLANKLLLLKLARKYYLGIITGAKRKETINILNKLNILELFSVIITATDSIYRKPNSKLFPKLNIKRYIGDTKKDYVFAQRANIPFFRVNKKYNIDYILKKLI